MSDHNAEKAAPWWRPFRRAEERRAHNDRDYECRYWWGDRGRYSLRAERCAICNPTPPGSL